MTNRKIRLGAFISGPGHHVAAWRHPEAQADGRFNFKYLKNVTQTAERGLFGAVFLADGLAAQLRPGAEGRTANGGGFEPVTLFSALSAVTEHIGFIALVEPELQRRGLFRTAYEGRALRENLGLARPANTLARRRTRAA